MSIAVYLAPLDSTQLLTSAQYIFNQLQDQLNGQSPPLNIYLNPVGDIASLQLIFNQLQDQLQALTTPISVYLSPVGIDPSAIQYVFNQLQDQLQLS